MSMPPTNDDLREEFEMNYRVDPDGCWLWTGDLTDNGYPLLSWSPNDRGGGRVSVELSGRKVPPRHLVARDCLRSTCVNPDHLTVMSRSEFSQRPKRKTVSKELEALL